MVPNLYLMGRKKPTSQIFASAHSFSNPEGLERSVVTDRQVRWDESTIMWGDDDCLPMRILSAVNSSPTTTSCLGKVADYMQGSGFSDKELMRLPIDMNGTTLWELHSNICDYMSKLEGFTTRFTFDGKGDITNTYLMGIESCRLKRPDNAQGRNIKEIKYNPYWGTSEFKLENTICYNVWEPDKIKRYQEVSNAETDYTGQVYFYGNPRAPYKFYPIPKYWSGSNWIYVDAQVQAFIKKLLDNGFFQSVLINMIGDPTQPSKNPKYQVDVTGTDGTVRKEWDGKTTVGVEFQEMMSKAFSGFDKTGTAMVFWAQTLNEIAKIEAFPVNANFDNISGTMTNAIRGITIATEVPAVLANLPQQVSSLGSDGEAMRMAVELMQARVKEYQNVLEQFYNLVLLPNIQNKTQSRVKIVNHAPLSNQIQVPDKVWEWMNDEEKADFVRVNVPSVKVIRPVVAPVTPTTPGQEPATEAKVNEALKGLKVSEINRIKNVANKVEKGALTYEQGKQLLQSYGFDDEQIKAWLTEEAVTV